MARNAIFISYSHADKQWLERFENALRIGVTSESFSIWSDQRIGAGRPWEHEIEAIIASAGIALLCHAQIPRVHLYRRQGASCHR